MFEQTLQLLLNRTKHVCQILNKPNQFCASDLSVIFLKICPTVLLSAFLLKISSASSSSPVFPKGKIEYFAKILGTHSDQKRRSIDLFIYITLQRPNELIYGAIIYYNLLLLNKKTYVLVLFILKLNQCSPTNKSQ